jgi:hypothetical protein
MAGIVSENPGVKIEIKHELPPCALDNDVLVEVRARRLVPPWTACTY